MTPAEFKRKWARYSGKEMAAYQEHFNDLCALLRPHALDDRNWCDYPYSHSVSQSSNTYTARGLPITSNRNSTYHKFSWYTGSRTCCPSSHNSICPSSCLFRGKSFSAPRQTRLLRALQESAPFVVSWPSCDHLLSFIKFEIPRSLSLYLNLDGISAGGIKG